MRWPFVFILFFFKDCFSYTTRVRGVQVHKVPLITSQSSSPFTFAASAILDLETNDNFLATQVWPAARVASLAVQKHAQPDWNIIEMGCGPGLPSLTAASLGCDAIATDVDGFALQLVQAAANEQGFTLQTKRFDLINDELDSFPDLVILSDVFEHASVAVGAARVTIDCLSAGSRVWVFCQSDRAQRQGYIEALQESSLPFAKTLAFSNDGYNPENQLWLCDLDELDVRYG